MDLQKPRSVFCPEGTMDLQNSSGTSSTMHLYENAAELVLKFLGHDPRIVTSNHMQPRDMVLLSHRRDRKAAPNMATRQPNIN